MHRLVIGIPETGKTTFAQCWCRSLARTNPGLHRVALNPFHDPGWAICEFQSPNPDEILAYARQPFPKAIFLEEAGTSLNKDRKFDYLTSGSRHSGNGTWLIAQGAKMLSLNLRSFASEVYLFRCSRSDAEMYADFYDCPAILEATRFPPGQFLILSTGPIRCCRLNLQSGDFEDIPDFFAE